MAVPLPIQALRTDLPASTQVWKLDLDRAPENAQWTWSQLTDAEKSSMGRIVRCQGRTTRSFCRAVLRTILGDRLDMQSAHTRVCFVRVGSCRLGTILGSILGAFWGARSPQNYFLVTQGANWVPRSISQFHWLSIGIPRGVQDPTGFVRTCPRGGNELIPGPTSTHIKQLAARQHYYFFCLFFERVLGA